MRIDDYISQLTEDEAEVADEALGEVYRVVRASLPGSGHDFPGDDRLAEIEHTIARYIVEART